MEKQWNLSEIHVSEQKIISIRYKKPFYCWHFGYRTV